MDSACVAGGLTMEGFLLTHYPISLPTNIILARINFFLVMGLI